MNQLALEKDYYIQMQEEEIARLSQNGQTSAEAEMNAELGITELAHWISWWHNDDDQPNFPQTQNRVILYQ